MLKIIVGALLASVSFAASAADLRVPAQQQRPIAGCDWCGFYFGLHGGYGWSRDNVGAGIEEIVFGDLKPAGGVFGAQLGYNWQIGSVVTGVEIDYSHLGFTDSLTVLDNREVDVALGVKTKDLASARGKIGLLLTPAVLAYLTGGIGWGHAEAFITNGVDTLTAPASHWGWVAGGGIEMKVMNNWLLRGEWLHYDLGTASYSISPSPVSLNGSLHVDVARAALSYRFAP